MTHADIDIDYILALTHQAGEAIMEVYKKDFTVEYKDDRSPLTAADKLSNKIIIDGLLKKYPGSNIISEENKQIPYEERKDWSSFWLIDPIDGTKEFIKKNGEFTVNIALVENGVPTLGFVYAPALGLMYYGIKDKGSFKETKNGPEKLKPCEPYMECTTIRVVGSRSHMSEETMNFVKDLELKGKSIEFISSGSSLKLCMVADGVADVYPRFGPTMEWDTGAAHAVALYAGKQVINAHTGQPLVYNKENLLNPSFIVG
ncbi:MAG: 3(2),5-bisphosphate nucleotidase [Bacteroidetes bacterium]|nr:3(2),5-bisphosphate nucleotidase [Bacteroidota bacterium]